MSDLMIDMANEAYLLEKEEWIRDQLQNPEADESIEGWHELEQQYDEISENMRQHMEEEYEWYHSQNHSYFYASFVRTLDEIQSILKSHTDPENRHTLYKMSYVHAATAMETYLGDSLKSMFLTNPEYVLNAAKNLDGLKNKKFKPEAFLLDNALIEKAALSILRKLLYHDVVMVMKIYKQILNFRCSYNLSQLIKIATIRHDIVHRNGKNNEGGSIQVNLSDLNMAVNEIKSFIKYLDVGLESHRSEV